MEKSTAIIKKEEWFQNLCEEIKAIAITKIFINPNFEIIEGKWLIGKEIEEALADKSRADIYGKQINKMIAQEIRVSEREIQRCRQFYASYPLKDTDKMIDKLNEVISKMSNGKLTWKFITNNVLPEKKDPKAKEHEYISIRIDEENKTLYIHNKYQGFDIQYYE